MWGCYSKLTATQAYSHTHAHTHAQVMIIINFHAAAVTEAYIMMMIIY